MSITPVYVNRAIGDDDRRTRIFDGALFLYSSPPASTKMVEWARELIHAHSKTRKTCAARTSSCRSARS
jgi:hypothetical protein